MAKWIKNCKVRTFKKIYGRTVDVDGVLYRLRSYSKLINIHSQLTVGDPIYNIYIGKYERISEIRDRWHPIDGTRNGKWREIYFITESKYLIYDINDRNYAKPSAWDNFVREVQS